MGPLLWLCIVFVLANVPDVCTAHSDQCRSDQHVGAADQIASRANAASHTADSAHAELEHRLVPVRKEQLEHWTSQRTEQWTARRSERTERSTTARQTPSHRRQTDYRRADGRVGHTAVV